MLLKPPLHSYFGCKKQVGLLNVDGYYDCLLGLFDKGVEEGFIKPSARNIIISAKTARELILRMEVLKFFPSNMNDKQTNPNFLLLVNYQKRYSITETLDQKKKKKIDGIIFSLKILRLAKCVASYKNFGSIPNYFHFLSSVWINSGKDSSL